MFCHQCGEKNPDVNRFCFECGARLLSSREGLTGPLTDDVSARLVGLDGLPEPSLDWPDDLPRDVTGSDGARLLLVPAGFFHMGAAKAKKDERPHRMVYLDSYYVQETPVTNGQYLKFVESSRVRAPKHFRARRKEPEWERLPVVGVTWDEAAAYAKWVSRRLPSEAEWEKAARGVDSRTWPWGDIDPTGHEPPLANIDRERALTTPVDAHPDGASPLGCLDMAGNAWEWCQDQYDQFYYPRSPARNPVCEDGDPRYRVLRGGACTYSAFTARTTYRGWNLPHMRSAVYGFRTVADVARYRKRRKRS